MRAFQYIAYNAEGQRKNGTIIAEGEAHAAAQLKERGLFVSDLTARAGRKSYGLSLDLRWRTQLNADLQAVFTRQMAVLLAADLPSEAALEAVRSSGGNPAMDAVAARAKAALMDGWPLSEALEESGAGFARYYIAAISAGESSGDIATVFDELANHLENVGQDRAQIASALIYPAFVATVSLLVCAILMVSVAPEIVAMFELSGRPLPELTVAVLSISDWIQAHIVLLGVLAVVGGIGIILSGRNRMLRARRDWLVLRLPIIGRLKRLAASVQYLRTLALVLTSRHAVLSAVDSAGQVLTVEQFQREAAEVSDAVRSGLSLSEALERLSIIPPVARQLIGAGEISARLARMSERSAVLVENGLRAERKRIAALLEPMLMILVGGLVLVIVLAILLPIFDLQAAVTQ